MGNHTWFGASAQKYHRRMEIYQLMEEHDNGNRYLDDYHALKYEADELYDTSRTEYHNVFRAIVHSEDIFTSYEQTLQWLLEHDHLVMYPKGDKKSALKKLREFWEKYPEGIIYFN